MMLCILIYIYRSTVKCTFSVHFDSSNISHIYRSILDDLCQCLCQLVSIFDKILQFYIQYNTKSISKIIIHIKYIFNTENIY